MLVCGEYQCKRGSPDISGPLFVRSFFLSFLGRCPPVASLPVRLHTISAALAVAFQIKKTVGTSAVALPNTPCMDMDGIVTIGVVLGVNGAAYMECLGLVGWKKTPHLTSHASKRFVRCDAERRKPPPHGGPHSAVRRSMCILIQYCATKTTRLEAIAPIGWRPSLQMFSLPGPNLDLPTLSASFLETPMGSAPLRSGRFRRTPRRPPGVAPPESARRP